MNDGNNKTTLLDVIDNKMENLVWGLFIILLASVISIITITNNTTTRIEKESDNELISKLINDGYNPIVAGCALSNNSTACSIVASKIDLNNIKQDIK